MHRRTMEWAIRQSALRLLGVLACCMPMFGNAATTPAKYGAPAQAYGTPPGERSVKAAQEPLEEECLEEEEEIVAGGGKPAAAPPAPVAPAAPVKVAQTWEVLPTDKTLNGALARWASLAGWQLVWELPVDYSVEAKSVTTGNFEEAVGNVAKSMENAEVPMKAIFYAGNKVLRIVAKGNE